ncbi:MAG: copper-binding protein [Betaproteobacteria bacterium]|nr:copper-binding protein [Betaproteobacteria bacterium]
MKRLSIFIAAMLIALPAAAQTHQAAGVVTKVDEAKNSIEIKHEAIKSLNWPGMTMSFEVRDRKLLSVVKPQQKVTFELVQEKGRYVIVGIK